VLLKSCVGRKAGFKPIPDEEGTERKEYATIRGSHPAPTQALIGEFAVAGGVCERRVDKR
jgi:hypothetical protein